MRNIDPEQELRREFAEFVDVEPATPATGVDNTVLNMVARDLRPTPWKIFVKLTLVEVAAGLATLTVCPQFGLGFVRHNALLHDLHVATSPGVFYLLCGVLFVTLGAVLAGFVLTRHEIRAISHASNRYFALYSILAYLVLVVLSPELFVAASLTWIVGALLGNILGYAAAVRIRQAANWRFAG